MNSDTECNYLPEEEESLLNKLSKSLNCRETKEFLNKVVELIKTERH